MIETKYLESVIKSGLFKHLKEDDYEKAWSELRMATRRFTDQQIIYSQGDEVGRVGIVHSGLIKGEKFHEEGSSHLAYMYSGGEAFAVEAALSAKQTSPLDFVSEGDSTVIFFDVATVYEGSFAQELLKGFAELLASDNIKKLYRIETLSKKGLRDRIMTYFMILADKSKSREFTLSMSRQQMAHYLCVNRTALSHELNEMKREGIIEINKKKIILIDA